MGNFAALVSCVGSVSSITPVFDANTYDNNTFEMLGVKEGVGQLTEARAYQIEVLNDQGVYVTVPGGQPAWQDARWDNGVAYADDGAGTLLDPLPKLVHAPQATNYLRGSRNAYTTANGALIARDAVGIDGVPNTAQTITDASVTVAASALTYNAALEASEGKATVLLKIRLKRQVAPTVFPTLYAKDTSSSGTSQLRKLLNLETGDVVNYLSSGNGSDAEWDVYYSKLVGDYWEFGFQCTPGGLATGIHLYVSVSPASRSTFVEGSAEVNHIGSVVVDWCEAYLGVPIDTAKDLPPIYTETVAVTRDACALSYDSANHDDTEGTYLIEAEYGTNGQGILSDFLRVISTNIRLNDGSNFADVTGSVGTPHKIGIVYGAGVMKLNVDGVWSANTTYDGSLPDGVLDLFRLSSGVNYAGMIKRYSVSNESIVDAWMAE